MAKSLAAGIAKDLGASVAFFIADPSQAAREQFVAAIGEASGGKAAVHVAESNQAVVDQAELVFLAIKPQYLDIALEEVRLPTPAPLVVSIIAGVDVFQLERLTGTNRIIRVMPNTPCLIGHGASAIAAGQGVAKDDVRLVTEMLKAVGSVVEVEPNLMDAVTGLSGSGPAYVFTFLEALIDGGVLNGLPRATARDLAIQTVIGAATMVQQSGEHPAVLRDRVTSPGGTTIAGVKSLEENAFRDAVMSAVMAATERSSELGD